MYLYEKQQGLWEDIGQVDLSDAKIDSYEQYGWWGILYCKGKQHQQTYLFDTESDKFYSYSKLEDGMKIFGYSKAFHGFLGIQDGVTYNLKCDELSAYSQEVNDVSDMIEDKIEIADDIQNMAYEEFNDGDYSYTTLAGSGYGNIVTYADGVDWWDEVKDFVEVETDINDRIYCPTHGKWYIIHAVYSLKDESINSFYLENGKIYCIGENNQGQLGYTGSTDASNEYSEIDNAVFKDFISSYNGCIALDEEGNLWGWGNPYYGGNPKVIINHSEYSQE